MGRGSAAVDSRLLCGFSSNKGCLLESDNLRCGFLRYKTSLRIKYDRGHGLEHSLQFFPS